ncbi:MAG: hypothetical protein K6L80_08950 [Agarilytica sp.]
MNDTQLVHEDHTPKTGTSRLSVLLHNMELASNIGSIFRISDALGIDHIYLSGDTHTPPNRKITKTSRSTEKYVPYSYENDALKLLTRLKQQDYLIVSLEICSGSEDLKHFHPPTDRKICLIVGSENKGIHSTLVDLSDHTIHIPMHGHNSSMNVANACAIASYDIIAKRSRLMEDQVRQ